MTLVEAADSNARGWESLAWMTFLAVVSAAVVGARIWTRKVLQKQFALEDWFIVAGTV